MSRDNCRVFTFGIGNDCDRDLVTRVAKAGRGSHNLVKDGQDNLKAVVVKALAHASQPSLKDCDFKFGTPSDLF